MYFIVYCIDKPDHGHLRTENRPAHLDYLNRHRDNLYTAGPTLDEDGETMTGSLLIVDFPDRAAVEAFAADEPYARAGLFERVDIKPWKMVFEPQD